MRQLRDWQIKCVRKALAHYKKQRHFLCLATPGAGKSIMAAELASRLLEQNKIDAVLCFSPSREVANNLRDVFAKRLSNRFDGVIGAIGGSYTYHSLIHLPKDFWKLFKSNRVLVVFDEIHHCAGSSVSNANAWGEQIIVNIQHEASYTLALSGTPWRSDCLPIVLQSYELSPPKIECHFRYGLGEAVRDNVCRTPCIISIDNECIEISDDQDKKKTFGSFKELFASRKFPYQALISNQRAMHYIIGKAINKLQSIRQHNKSAGGLIVASTVNHAVQISAMLTKQFNLRADIVTYKHQDAQKTIQSFKGDDIPWIISVGMISEGTDIPRLQVCVHLSRIKTEMYFRQVLGRILRTSGSHEQQAWLYTFAEPKLVEYAQRIDQEIPESQVLLNEVINFDNKIDGSKRTNAIDSNDFNLSIQWEDDDAETKSRKYFNNAAAELNQHQHTVNLLGKYREQVIAAFESPF